VRHMGWGRTTRQEGRAAGPSPWPATRPVVGRPLVGLALSLTAGIALGLRLHGDWLLPIGVAGAGIAAAVGFRRTRCAPLFIHAAVMAVGALHAQLAIAPPTTQRLDVLMDRPAEHVRLTGVVVGDPAFSPGYREGQQIVTFALAVEGVRRIGVWQRARGRITVRWRTTHPGPAIRYGERWMLAGVLKDRDRLYRQRFARRRFALDMRNGRAEKLSSGHGFAVVALALEARRHSARILARGIEDFPEQVGLLHALLLGYRHALPDKLHEVFSRTGTLHIFAISGLHVGIVAALCIGLLRSLNVSRQHWILVLAPFLLLYTIGTGMKASAVRACVMAVTYWSAPLLNRKPDAPSAFALAALLILGAAPTQLEEPGFIFSFVIVGGLIVLVARMTRPLEPLLSPEPWRLEPLSWPRRAARAVAMGTVSLACVSAAAWFSSAPLTAHYFNLVAPIALLGNMLVVPVAFLIVLTGCLSLLVGMLVPLAAEAFNHANRLFVSILVAGIDFFASVRGGHFFVRSPPWGWMLLWYGLLVGVVWGQAWIRRILLALAPLALATSVWLASANREVRIEVLDTGGPHASGSGAMFIDLPGGGDVLFDTGSRFQAWRIVRFLRKRGVDGLRALVLSHADARHIGAAPHILRTVSVDELWVSPHRARSASYKEALAEAGRRGVPVRELRRGDRGVLAGGVEWEVLHPGPTEAYGRADDASLVFRLSREAVSLLLMGGAGAAVEKELLELPVEYAANFLLVGNEGAAHTCSDDWLAEVDPDWALISVERGNVRNTPAPETLERLAARAIPVLRTDEQGRIEIAVFEEPWRYGEVPYRLVTDPDGE